MEKQTFLHEQQLKLNAKMVSYNGWYLPEYYTNAVDENLCVRQNCGLFDLSFLGIVVVKGSDSLDFMQKICPQDISKLDVNDAVYCQLTTRYGTIIDDFITYKLKDDKFLLILNSKRLDIDLNWISRNSLNFDVEIINESHNYSLLSLQGPKSSKLIEKMGLKEQYQPKYFQIKRVMLDTVRVYISRTGFTGEDGFEILVKNKFSEFLWHEMLLNGEEFNIQAIGLDARNSLRLEAGYHMYGLDLNDSVTPFEANIQIPKDKKADYNGKVHLFSDNFKFSKYFVTFISKDDSVLPKNSDKIYFENEEIGYVTSAVFSPALKKNIGMGYLDVSKIGLTKLNKYKNFLDMDLQIMIDNNMYDVHIVKRPFIKKNVRSKT